MTIRRVTRDRRLTLAEAAKYDQARAQVAQELPAIVARHHERTASLHHSRRTTGDFPPCIQPRRGDSQ
jgi:hypothetical protein